MAKSAKATPCSSRSIVTAALALFAATVVWLALLAPAHGIAAPPLLWQACDADDPAGQRCSFPRGIAADPLTGHVFVADQFNSRVVEFDAIGQFVKAWGWDVVQSGPGEDTTPPEDQFEICAPEDGDVCKAGTDGQGGGQFAAPRGVALDSAGNVYVVDKANQRVQKFNRAGEFQRLWGGDVVFTGPNDSPNDELQELKIAAGSGNFSLGVAGILDGSRDETAPLPFNASAAQVEAALNALPSVGGLGGSVSVTGGPGDATGSSPYTVTFQGTLAGDDLAPISVALGVGSTLQCSTSTTAESIAYQWLNDGSPVAGATSSTYVATAADAGDAIQCQVTATNANAGSTQVSDSPQLIAPAPNRPLAIHPAPIAAPEPSAPLGVGGGGGQVLTCDPDAAGWQETSSNFFGYRWFRNGAEISDATSSTYTVTAPDLVSPAVFQCQVTYHGLSGEDPRTAKISANRATVPAPSAPAAPVAQASTSPGNGVASLAEGGGPEVCRSVDSCKAGSRGSAPGEFGALAVGSYIAIDRNGTATEADDDVWVGDEGRIQRFDTEGGYQGEIAVPGETVQSLAVDAAGNLYAAYNQKAGVHKLSPAGEPLPPSFVLTMPDGSSAIPTAIAVGAGGHVLAFGPTTFGSGSAVSIDPIFEFDPSGKIVDRFGKGEFDNSTGLATNLCSGSEAPGNVYVTNRDASKAVVRAYGTEPSGCGLAITGEATDVEETTATLTGTVNPNGFAVEECRFEYGLSASPYEGSVACAESPASLGTGFDPVPVHADLTGLPAGAVHHFRLTAKSAAGIEKGSDRTFKTKGPPVISEDHTVTVADTEASVRALVNPEGFPATYRFEYGPDTSYGQSTPEIAVGKDRTEHPVSATLTGLEPGQTYHWRIVATNSSGSTEGEDHQVDTYRAFSAETDCPNQAFRTAASALLPDCRAHEMVSPVDKNGGDIINGMPNAENPGGFVQSSLDGDRIAYVSRSAFADQPNNFQFNPYMARRAGTGWATEGIHPPVHGTPVDAGLFGLYREIIAFSPDLCSVWLVDYQTPTLTPDAQQGYRNLYRRNNCAPGIGELEALTPEPPTLSPSTEEGYVNANSVHGISKDGQRAFFAARAKLTGDAFEGGNTQVYERFEGELSVVSVLPGGEADQSSAEVGSGWGGNLEGAVSSDGSRVYWTSGINSNSSGTIFLREHPEQGIVAGECSEPAKACTKQVSGSLPAYFWDASADGSRALYSEGPAVGEKALYVFDRQGAEEAQPPRLVAAGVLGVLGASEDLGRIYLVARDALSGAGTNSKGEEAIAGDPNIYLDEEGALSFVGTLAEADVVSAGHGTAYNLVGGGVDTAARATRVSPDGSRIVFNSRGVLTGFDNRDGEGRRVVEVFAYEAGGELVCVSCNPGGARPQSAEMRQPYSRPGEAVPTDVFAAAWIPTWEHPTHASNVLSADGERLFFNSHDALVPRDTNGAQDVYQWEAPGKGRCTEQSSSYFPQNGGCIDLISSGESPFESEFWEASPDGEDVFFTTESSLLPQDPGLVDLYDARVGGGFAQPAAKAACVGEACQSAPPPPNDPTPASAGFRGPGNPTASKPRPRRCPTGKRQVRRKGKVRCVKRGRQQNKRTARHGRRAKHDGRAKR